MRDNEFPHGWRGEVYWWEWWVTPVIIGLCVGLLIAVASHLNPESGMCWVQADLIACATP